MASNYTRNYNLCQWVKSDKVLMEEFNADNAKIDAAIRAVDLRVTGLSGDKASQNDLDELAALVSGHTSTLVKKGNCQIYTASYTGNGLYGSANPRTLTFPGKPLLVAVNGEGGFSVMIQGIARSAAAFNTGYPLTVSWSGNSVSWYHDGSAREDPMFNHSGKTYQAIALVKLS